MTLLKHFDSPDVNKSQLGSKRYIIQKAESPLKLSDYKQLTISMYHQLNWIKNQLQRDYEELPEFKKFDFKFKKQGFKKLLIFDLDETLIHVKRSIDDDGVQDENVDQGFEPEVEIEGIYDKTTGEYTKASFSVRPYARECLQFANKYFEVAIFTAGAQWFAEPILNYLDPRGSMIQHRFYRQHTSQLGEESGDTLYVKDLSILCGINSELTLDDILIVDNMIYSFAFNLENGIPILNYVGDKNDVEMLHVMQYLKSLKNCENLRLENEKVYNLNYIYQNIEDFIEHYQSSDSDEDEEKDFDYDGFTAHDQYTDYVGNKSISPLQEINEDFSLGSSNISDLVIQSPTNNEYPNPKNFFKKPDDEECLTLGVNTQRSKEADGSNAKQKKPEKLKSHFINIKPLNDLNSAES